MKKLSKKPKDGKSITKFGDITLTPKERLHAFLQVNKGKEGKCEEYKFLGENYSVLIYLINEAFGQYQEHFQAKKGKKSGTDESDLLEVIIPSLEKVLQFLPHKIHALWHYHGIATMLKEMLLRYEMLAPNNVKDLRCKGIKLTILWIMGLLNQHDEIAVDVFRCMLPELPQQNQMQNCSTVTTAIELLPFLLDNLTSNIKQIYWPDLTPEETRQRQVEGFRTVFNLCKRVYCDFLFIYNRGKRTTSTMGSTSTLRSSEFQMNSPRQLAENRYSTLSGNTIRLGDISFPRPTEGRSTHSTTSCRSDVDTPTPTSPVSRSTTDPFSYRDNHSDEEYDRKCRRCGSEAHDTDRCNICEECMLKPHFQVHKTSDCPKLIEAEVFHHFTKQVKWISTFLLDLNDAFMRWFIKQAKNILPHSEKYCQFVTVTEDDHGKETIEKNENYADQVEVCEIVDRVLFTDRDNINLMNHVFELTPLALRHLKEEEITKLMSEGEDEEFSFIKMLTLYYELIMNIKEYNLSHDHDKCPEFLSDKQKSRSATGKIKKRRLKSFLKAITLNVAPLLLYPEAYKTFSSETKRKIEKVAQYTTALYLSIIQKIEEADAITCYRIIYCIIYCIEQNHSKGCLQLSSYKTHLEHLLMAVRFVGRKVMLPYETWEHLRKLLKTLERDGKANEIWNTSMEEITHEISVLVYNLELNCIRGSSRDDKAPKAKGKLMSAYQTEEKSHLASSLKKAANKFKVFRTNHIKHKPKANEPDKGCENKPIDYFHYHGLNEIFTESTSYRNKNPNKDDVDDDDDLRDNKGEHPIMLWRRFLSLKGNPNKYTDGDLHRRMFASLSTILDLLLRVDANKDTQETTRCSQPQYQITVPEHPVFTYIYHILPWLFEAFIKKPPSNEFSAGRKEAMRMLCRCLIRLNPIKPPKQVLHIFYNILLVALEFTNTKKQYLEKLHPQHELLCEVVKGCKHIFSYNLDGCQLLMGCLLDGAIHVLSDYATSPKAEAIILLGSLYSLPWADQPMKQKIISRIRIVARSETDQFYRSRALGMLGYMILTLLAENEYTEQASHSPESPTQIIRIIESTFDSHVTSLVFDATERAKTESRDLVDLVNIVLLQVRSDNSLVALSALAVIRDMTGSIHKLLDCDITLPTTIIENLLAALDRHMECIGPIHDDYDTRSTCSNSLFDPIANTSTTSFQPSKPPNSRDVIKAYQEAVVTTTMWTIVEWVLHMPSNIQNLPYTELLHCVFKVLQLVALNKPFSALVTKYKEEQRRKIHEYEITDMKEEDINLETLGHVESSFQRLPGSQNTHETIASCAETALFLMCQRYHQFPLCGGPDYSSSMVYEYECRKLLDEHHREELRLFNRDKNLQMVMLDDRIVVSMIEFESIPKATEDLFDLPFESQPGYGRVIFRNVAGRFSWLSKRLYGLKDPPNSPPPLLHMVDQTEEEQDVSDTQYHTLTASQRNTGPPRHDNRDHSNPHDLLFQTLDHIKDTSGELPFFRRRKNGENAHEEELYSKINSLLENQQTNEQNCDSANGGMQDNMTMRSDVSYSKPASTPSPFQQCRGIASNLGLLNWNKRFDDSGRRVELLDHKNPQMENALMEFDMAYNREVLKFGLVYIAKGQEKRDDFLRNDIGSSEFEEFTAGLGWEKYWQDLQGFSPTIGSELETGSTIHFATPTLEIVFHVSTRLSPGTQEPSLYKYKYIGNDYVVVVWSEHDRDVNIDVFKSQYLDIIIVIYPIPQLKKYRVQIIVKDKAKIEPFIGPLFDGALINKDVLPDLVRKTCINACRVIAVAQNRPTFYIDRALARDKLIKFQKKCTFEELATEVMSPSLYNFSEFKEYQRTQSTSDKATIQRTNSRITKRGHARQSTGHSSQDNMSENERSGKKFIWTNSGPARQASDSDHTSTKR